MFVSTDGLGGLRVYAHAKFVFVQALEFHFTVDHGVNGMITAHANIAAQVELCSTLANDNGSGIDQLTAEALHAQAFTL
jgi:hypothetical protein